MQENWLMCSGCGRVQREDEHVAGPLKPRDGCHMCIYCRWQFTLVDGLDGIQRLRAAVKDEQEGT